MQTTENIPSRPAIKWHGAKWRAAKWIISFIPIHDSYIEPYGGSAAVLLKKSRSLIEVYNDLDKGVVNFFQCLRDNATELIRVIELTPFAYDEWLLSWQTEEELAPIESARRFYVRSHMSIAGPSVKWGNAFRRQKVYSRGKSMKSSMKPAAISFMETQHLSEISNRLRGVTIENMDALDLMIKYDNPSAFFYVDPPYVFSTRANKSKPAYEYDMVLDRDHEKMAGVLKKLEGFVLLSGYESDLYKEYFPNWQSYSKTTRINGDSTREEHVWLNPRLAQATLTGQFSLFSR